MLGSPLDAGSASRLPLRAPSSSDPSGATGEIELGPEPLPPPPRPRSASSLPPFATDPGPLPGADPSVRSAGSIALGAGLVGGPSAFLGDELDASPQLVSDAPPFPNLRQGGPEPPPFRGPASSTGVGELGPAGGFGGFPGDGELGASGDLDSSRFPGTPPPFPGPGYGSPTSSPLDPDRGFGDSGAGGGPGPGFGVPEQPRRGPGSGFGGPDLAYGAPPSLGRVASFVGLAGSTPASPEPGPDALVGSAGAPSPFAVTDLPPPSAGPAASRERRLDLEAPESTEARFGDFDASESQIGQAIDDALVGDITGSGDVALSRSGTFDDHADDDPDADERSYTEPPTGEQGFPDETLRGRGFELAGDLGAAHLASPDPDFDAHPADRARSDDMRAGAGPARGQDRGRGDDLAFADTAFASASLRGTPDPDFDPIDHGFDRSPSQTSSSDRLAGEGFPDSAGRGLSQPGYGDASQLDRDLPRGYPEPGFPGHAGFGDPAFERGATDGGFTDGGTADQAFGARGFGDQGFGNQGFGNQGFGDQGFGDQGVGARGFGAQDPGARGFGNQHPSARGFGDQDPGARGFGDQDPGARGFEDAGFGARGFGDQGFGARGFGDQEPPARGFGDQGHAARGFGHEGFGREGFGHEGVGHEGFGHEGFGHEGFGARGAGDPAIGAPGFGDPGPANRGFGDRPPVDAGYADRGFDQRNGDGGPAGRGFGEGVPVDHAGGALAGPDFGGGFSDRGLPPGGFPDRGFPPGGFAERGTPDRGTPDPVHAEHAEPRYAEASYRDPNEPSFDAPAWAPVFGEQVYGDPSSSDHAEFPAEPPSFRPSQRRPLDYYPPDQPGPSAPEQPDADVPPGDDELRPAKAVWKQPHASSRRWADKRRTAGVGRAPSPPRMALGLLLAGLGAWLLLSFLPDHKPLTASERERISHQAGVDENVWRFPPPLYPVGQGGAALYVSLGFLVAVRGLFYRRRVEIACRRCRRVVVAERRALTLRCESGPHPAGINWGAIILQLAVLAVTIGLVALFVIVKFRIDIGLGIATG